MYSLQSKTIFFVLILLCSCKANTSKKETPIVKENAINDDSYKYNMAKFESKYGYKDFPINETIKKNPNLKINTNQNSFTKRYRTMIIQSFDKKEVNFAGKYIINYWGCGSPCQIGIAINTESGELIQLPTASVGYEFQNDSRLLTTNPPDSLGYYIEDCAYCIPEQFYLDTLENKFKELIR